MITKEQAEKISCIIKNKSFDNDSFIAFTFEIKSYGKIHEHINGMCVETPHYKTSYEVYNERPTPITKEFENLQDAIEYLEGIETNEDIAGLSKSCNRRVLEVVEDNKRTYFANGKRGCR